MHTLRHLAVLVALLLTLLLVPLTGASAQTGTVALVEGPAGLEVVTLDGWHTAPGRVIATAEEVLLHPAEDYANAAPVELPANDEFRFAQWGLDAVHAEAAWPVTQGDGVVVAIVDSGIDGSHPDLAPALVPGMSTVDGPADQDTLGHGTHVAGIVAAVGGNDLGTAGVAPRARLMPVRVLADGAALSSNVAKGVIWAADHGADVISISLAGPSPSAVLNAALDYAIAQGSIVVVAAGNAGDKGNPAMWPASHDPVIAVGAIDEHHRVTAFSSSGPYVDVAAPGRRIYSTRPDGRWGNASGTSSATPHVSGAAALLLGVDPTLTQDAIAELLAATAVDIETRGRDDRSGAGVIDVAAALDAVGALPPPPEEPPAPEVEEIPEHVLYLREHGIFTRPTVG